MKPKIKKNETIHCKTNEEFDRILILFELNPEFMDWTFYEQDTVLYPLENAYGDINGICKKNNFIVLQSENIS